jgi:membrane associated rhomboid family serine protease
MGLESRDYYRPSGFGGFSYFPPMIKYLLITNVIVFFIQILTKMFIYGYTVSGYAVTYDYLLSKYFALNPLGGGEESYFYPWQLLTYQFMHDTSNIFHLVFNMFFLWMFGMEIENIMGSKKFLIFYLTCGVGAGILQLLVPALFAESVGITIGASGAVYGVMVAYAMYFPDRYLMFWFLIPVKAKYMIAFLVVIEFLSVGNQSVVAHMAHVGGALTGFIFILLSRRNEFSRKNIFGSFKKTSDNFSSSFRKQFGGYNQKEKNVEDATFYDINNSNRDEEIITQEQIDDILDKISKSGYQNLTDREKKILFEASKRK